MTSLQVVGFVVVSALLVFAPAVLVLAIRRSLDREERRRPSSGSAGAAVTFRPGVSAIPGRFEPFDWDDDDGPAAVYGEVVRDHGHDTVIMRAIEAAGRECDETQVIPVQRRGGVR